MLVDVAVPARVRAGRAEQNFRRFESDNGGHGARVIVFAEIALSTQDTDRIFADESQIGACDRKSAEIFLDVQVTRQQVESLVGEEIDRSIELCRYRDRCLQVRAFQRSGAATTNLASRLKNSFPIALSRKWRWGI